MLRIRARKVSQFTFFVERILPTKLKATLASATFITTSSRVTDFILVLARLEQRLFIFLFSIIPTAKDSVWMGKKETKWIINEKVVGGDLGLWETKPKI